MLAEFVSKILSLSAPNLVDQGDLKYSDKTLNLITPPEPAAVACSTLDGLVGLWEADLDDAKTKSEDLVVLITSPTEVHITSRESDAYGRRRTWAVAKCPSFSSFAFGCWLDPESFIISVRQNFQRVLVQNDDGSYSKGLDYVLSIASKISAEAGTEYEDDGLTQKVAVKSGVVLKGTATIDPFVDLAPFRTFAEIDQVLSRFVFRARVQGGTVALALFEIDGGRWKLAAAAAIKAYLCPKFGDVPVVA